MIEVDKLNSDEKDLLVFILNSAERNAPPVTLKNLKYQNTEYICGLMEYLLEGRDFKVTMGGAVLIKSIKEKILCNENKA